MRCPEWSAKHASFETAALLLGPVLHGFLCENMHPKCFSESFNNGALGTAELIVAMTSTRHNMLLMTYFTAESKCFFFY